MKFSKVSPLLLYGSIGTVCARIGDISLPKKSEEDVKTYRNDLHSLDEPPSARGPCVATLVATKYENDTDSLTLACTFDNGQFYGIEAPNNMIEKFRNGTYTSGGAILDIGPDATIDDDTIIIETNDTIIVETNGDINTTKTTDQYDKAMTIGDRSFLNRDRGVEIEKNPEDKDTHTVSNDSVELRTRETGLNRNDVTRTMRVGGEGGFSFDDSHEYGDFGKISYIEVRAGRLLDYIGVGYANGKFVSHGGSGGNFHRINLSESEHIVRISGRCGWLIDQISFTNQEGKTYGPYGGSGGSPFVFDFGQDNALLYLFGRSASMVDQLGFAYSKPLEAPELSTWFSPRYGGNGGTPFDDFQASNGLIGKITEIKVRAGWLVDSIEVCYKDSGCKKHGGNGGTQYSFKLDDDEYVTEIHGRSGSKVDQLQFFLNTGRVSPVYGGNGGDAFEIKKDNHVLSYFYGRSYSLLDQIGALFSEARPTGMEIIDMEYDLDTASLLAADPKTVATFFLTNDTSESQKLEQIAHFETSETEGTSVAETHSTSIGITFTQTWKKTLFGSGKESSLEISFGYNYDETVTTEKSITTKKAETYRLSVVVGPGKTTRATVVVKEGVFNVSWTATARVFYSNTSDFTEKKITGVLSGVSVSSIEGEYEDV